MRRLKKCPAIVATLGVLALGLTPPEHVHVSRDADGHHSSVAHNHFEPHHGGEGTAVDEADHDGAQWIRSAFLHHQHNSSVPKSTAVRDQAPIEPRIGLTSRERAEVLFVAVHDPPWATPSGLRAPPSSRL